MNGIFAHKAILTWLFIGIPLFTFFIFRKSFDLGLYGDDWQHLYYLWQDFYVFKTKSFFDIKSYLNPYWPNYLYLGIINHFWDYYPPAYFIISYLFRLFANIALYFFSYELTKSKLAAILTTLIFLFSAAGLQTTDWVFNMNTYMGLGLLTIASTIYLKMRKLPTFKSWYYIFFIITFTLALAIVPTRMHGAVPVLILSELFLTYIVERQKIKIDKYLLARILLAVFIFYLLVHFRSFGEESYAGGRFADSTKLIQSLTQNGYFSWWLYFFATLGHLVLPDSVPIKTTLAKALLTVNFLSIIFLIICSYVITKSKKLTPYLPIFIFNIIFFLFLLWMRKIDSKTSADIYFAISLGGQFIFWGIWFFIIGGKQYLHLSYTLVITIFWIVPLTILYWLFTPYYVIETTGRYMTMGAAGMAIFLGSLSTLLFKASSSYSSQKNAHSKFLGSLSLGIPSVILIMFLLTNFSVGQNYFNLLHQTRNMELTERSWKRLVEEVPKLDSKTPSVFYFTTDNPTSLYGVFTFGFFMRAGLTWKIPVMEDTPLPCSDYQELLAFAKDGSPLQKIHGRKAVPVPLSRIFAFDFRNGEVIPITEQIRQKLAEDLSKI